MVRQSKQTQPDQKKDTSKKRTTQPQDRPSLKKPSDSTVWPCRINGCDKQFAREADLKRHQRTTKLHSMPGFACPQCDARFTRTDALRRHQKSRHNGVVIEPTDGGDRRTSAGDEDPHSSGSRSKSRSRTPSSKENPAMPVPSPLPPSTVPPAGPQSYYRQHTFTGVMIPPPGPGIMVDAHYHPPVGLPTSATRLHQASWQPTPPWGGDGSQPPPPHMIHPYVHSYYNPPPQYYRPGMVMHPSDAVAHQQISNGMPSSHNGESSSSRTSSPVLAVDPSLDHTGMEDPDTGDPESVVIDPSLVSPPANGVDSEPLYMSPKHPSMRHSASDGECSVSGQAPRIPETRTSPPGSSSDPPNEAGDDTDNETIIVRNMLSPSRGHSYPSPHSVPLDQILTEDGEPMLNPAELLTQESLASPPPS